MKHALESSSAPAQQPQRGMDSVRRRSYFGASRRDPVQTTVAPDPARPLLTIDEARVYLTLPSVHAVYRLVGKGLPCRKLGGALRFDFGELEAWTRRHRQDPAVALMFVKA